MRFQTVPGSAGCNGPIDNARADANANANANDHESR